MKDMKTRVAVIGVGALGRHHARILAALPDVELVGIVDINESRAREIGGLVNAPSFTNAAEMLGRVDAVTVAVPTESHLSGGAAVPAARHRRAGGEAARARCR